MKYRVNENCIACGLCTAVCPAVFQMTEEGRARAMREDVPEDALSAAAEAAEGCPADAIEEA